MKRSLSIAGMVGAGALVFALGVGSGRAWRSTGISAQQEPTVPVATPKPRAADVGTPAHGEPAPTRRELRALVAAWPDEKVRAQLDERNQAPQSEERTWWVRVLVETWAARNPREALAWSDANHGAHRPIIFATWATREPAAAATAASAGTTGTVASDLAAVFQAWTLRDAPAAEAGAAALPIGEARDAARRAYLETLSELNPAAAWNACKRGVGDKLVESNMGRIFAGLAEADPALALKEFAALPATTARAGMAVAMAAALAKSDPKLAAEFVATLPADVNSSDPARGVMDLWARQDPDAAFAWLRALPLDPRTRQSVATASVRLLAESAPAAASRGIDQVDATQRDWLTSVLAANWARTDPAAALEWSRGLKDELLRATAVAGVFTTAGAHDPERALAWIREEFSTLKPDLLGRSFATGVANLAPDRALALVPQLPEGEWRDGYVSALIESLGERRPEELAEALPGFGSSKQRSKDYAALARSWAGIDAPAAAAWVSTRCEPEMRAVASEAIARRWLEIDRVEGERWLAGAALPEAAKRKLLGELTPSR